MFPELSVTEPPDHCEIVDPLGEVDAARIWARVRPFALCGGCESVVVDTFPPPHPAMAR
jgi:hypothetical protein